MSELDSELYREDIIYRPPLEANSVLLEVTIGCTYAKCIYCCGQGHRGFQMVPLKTIEKNAAILGQTEENKAKTDVFLTGGNVFALKTNILKEIFSFIHQYLPIAHKISMYSRADDINRKCEEELKELKSLGLGDLYVGVESGSDKILRMCNKGVSTNDMLEAFALLDKVGIGYSLSSIIGLGGKEFCWEHATETAAFYNKIHPKTIRIMTLTPWPGTPLHDKIQEGTFTELTPGEILLEERLFLSSLNVDNCLFIGTHVSNNVPLAGILPEHKEILLDILDTVIVSMDLANVHKREFEHM